MNYKTKISTQPVGELAFELETLESLDHSVDDMFVELERLGSQELLAELCPYFGVVWPAALALSEWMASLGESYWRGKRVLELGCGLALPSFVASRLQAEVTASDLHPDVPDFLERNADRNPGTSVRYQLLDWRQRVSGTWDVIVASDILYEREYPEALAAFLARSLSPSGESIVVDPSRPFADRLPEALRSQGLVAIQSWKVDQLKTGNVLKQPCTFFQIRKADR